MKKLLLTTAAIALMAAPVVSFAADTEYNTETNVERQDDGDAKSVTETSSTDAAGTTITEKKKVETDMSDDGDYEKTITTTSKRDPEGLMNSTKTVTEDTVNKKGSKLTKRHLKKVDGDKVEDTKIETDLNAREPSAGETDREYLERYNNR